MDEELFSGVAVNEELDSVDPFALIPDPQDTTNLDDAAVERRAMKYAVADLDDDTATDPTTLEEFQNNQASILQNYRSLIATNKEQILIDQAKTKALQQGVYELQSIPLAFPEMNISPDDVLKQAMADKLADQEGDEATRQFAENILDMMASGDESLARLLYEDKETPDAFQMLSTRITRRMQLADVIEELGVESEHRFWFSNLLDYLMYVPPLTSSWAGTGNFEATTKRWYDGLLNGERISSETQNLGWQLEHASSDKEAREILKEFAANVWDQTTTLGWTNHAMLKQNSQYFLNRPSVVELNLYGVLDNLPLAGLAAKGTYSTSSAMFRMARGLGSRKIAGELAAKEIDNAIKSFEKAGTAADGKMAATAPKEVDELFEDVIPSAMNGTEELIGLKSTSLAGEAIEALTRGEELLKEIVGRTLPTTRLNEAELQNLAQVTADRMAKAGVNKKDRSYIQDYKVVERELPTGTILNHLEISLGTKNKTVFSRQGDAQNLIDKLNVEHGIVEELPIGHPDRIGNAKYVAKVRVPLDEAGLDASGMPFFTAPEGATNSSAFSIFSRFLASSRQTAWPEIFGLAGISTDKKLKVIAHANREILPRFHRLGNAERTVLQKVFERGAIDRTWYNDSQLSIMLNRPSFGLNPRQVEKAIDAYHAMRDLNDIEYAVRNLDLQTTLGSQAYQLVEFMGFTPQVGKVFRNVPDLPREVVYDATNGIPLIGESRISAAQLAERQANGDILVQLREPVKITIEGGEGTFKHVLLPKHMVAVKELPDTLIGYSPGGHRVYEGKDFVKRARRGTQPWGDEFMASPYTYAVAQSAAEAKLTAKVLEEARIAYNSGKTASSKIKRADEVLQAAKSERGFNGPTAEQFDEIMKTHGHKEPFHAVYDRELPPEYFNLRRGQVLDDFVEEELSGVESFLASSGRLFYSHKGDQLADAMDWTVGAAVLDPYRTATLAFENVAKLTGFTDFKLRAVNKWVNTYGRYLTAPKGSSPMRIFLEGAIKSNAPEAKAIKNTAETQRGNIRRMIGYKSETDLFLEDNMRRLFNALAGDDPSTFRHNAVNSLSKKWSELTPINAMRTLAFDMKLGFFNVAQFPLQVQTAFAALSIDPINGGTAFTNLPNIVGYTRRTARNKEEFLDLMVSRNGHKFAGFESGDEYKQMMRSLDQSGFLEVKDSHLMRGESGSNAAMGHISSGANNVRKAGRFFFDVAEQFNRAVAWQIAWKQVSKAAGSTSFPTRRAEAEFLERVRMKASDYSFNMDNASAAWWQKGAMAFPTQFYGYTARWWEMLMGKQLTDPQKIRFLVGQAIMYGTAGIPTAEWIADSAKRANNGSRDFEPNTPGWLLDRGLWDFLIYNTTGADVEFSQRSGLGSSATDIAAAMMGTSEYGDVAFIELAGGATPSIMWNTASSAVKTMWYGAAEAGQIEGMPRTEQYFTELARNISTVNNVIKANIVYTHGIWTSTKGSTQLDNVPEKYAVAAIFSLSPADLSELSLMRGTKDARDKDINEYVNIMSNYRSMMLAAQERGDLNEVDSLAHQINIVADSIPKVYKKDVYSQLRSRSASTTYYEQLGKVVDRNERRAKALREKEGN